MTRFTTLLVACVAILALTTVAEARLAGGKCSAKAFDELFSKQVAYEKRAYNIDLPEAFLRCTSKLSKPLFDQYCPACGVDKKCLVKSMLQHFVKLSQNKKELVNYGLSVFENPDCSAAIVPMGAKMLRLGQKLGRAPTEVEVVRLLLPGANLAAIAADVKEYDMNTILGLGKPVNQDGDEDSLGFGADTLGNAKGWRKHAQKGLKLWDEFWSSPYGKYAGAGMPGGKLQGINKFRPNYEHFRDRDEVDDLGWRRRK